MDKNKASETNSLENVETLYTFVRIGRSLIYSSSKKNEWEINGRETLAPEFLKSLDNLVEKGYAAITESHPELALVRGTLTPLGKTAYTDLVVMLQTGPLLM